MARKLISTTVYIRPDQDAAIKAMAARTGVPAAEYIRRGIQREIDNAIADGLIPAIVEMPEKPAERSDPRRPSASPRPAQSARERERATEELVLRVLRRVLASPKMLDGPTVDEEKKDDA